MKRAVNVLMAGVGGQGVLSASELLAYAALEQGLEAKQSEVHGVAQRGGSVVSHVRFGARVHSPLIRCGEVDILYAGEQLEALRYAHYLQSGGTLLISDHRVKPIRMPGAEETSYPEGIPGFLRGKGYDVVEVPALRIAVALGEKRCANVVLLGALSAFLDLDRASWEAAMGQRFPPKILDLNLRAFARGLEQVGAERAPAR